MPPSVAATSRIVEKTPGFLIARLTVPSAFRGATTNASRARTESSIGKINERTTSRNRTVEGSYASLPRSSGYVVMTALTPAQEPASSLYDWESFLKYGARSYYVIYNVIERRCEHFRIVAVYNLHHARNRRPRTEQRRMEKRAPSWRHCLYTGQKILLSAPLWTCHLRHLCTKLVNLVALKKL